MQLIKDIVKFCICRILLTTKQQQQQQQHQQPHYGSFSRITQVNPWRKDCDRHTHTHMYQYHSPKLNVFVLLLMLHLLIMWTNSVVRFILCSVPALLPVILHTCVCIIHSCIFVRFMFYTSIQYFNKCWLTDAVNFPCLLLHVFKHHLKQLWWVTNRSIWNEWIKTDPTGVMDSKKNQQKDSGKAGVKRTLLACVKTKKLCYFGHIMRHNCLE